MAQNNPLTFLFNISKQKPNSILNRDTICPFCHREMLDKVLVDAKDILIVLNKYPTIVDAFQTVLIETDDCNADFSNYDIEHIKRVLKIGLDYWFNLEKSGQYKSVVFFKNFGPLSGGSIKHSHMQIVGLKNIDYRLTLKDEYFEGKEIFKKDNCILNISTHPRSSFTEFNIILNNLDDLTTIASFIKIVVHYLLNNFIVKCHSYNMFFYQFKEKIICKIVPAFVSSPYFTGYGVTQISDSMYRIIHDIQKLYSIDVCS